MIYIEVKKDKWKELEHYHAEYIEETLPGRWKSFYKKEVPMTEIDVVCQILENHDMIKKESKELQIPNIIRSVSYTHLDVYKRQAQDGEGIFPSEDGG